MAPGEAFLSPSVARRPRPRAHAPGGSTTVTSRAFYDGLGHVETRTPVPGGQDVVRYRLYDPSQRLAFTSVPYFVSAYTGSPGAAAYSIPDSDQAGTTFTYDGLGRGTGTTDALSRRSTTGYTTVCGAPGTDALRSPLVKPRPVTVGISTIVLAKTMPSRRSKSNPRSQIRNTGARS